MNPHPLIVFAIACLVTWLFMGINARAQDRLTISKLGGTKYVSVSWVDTGTNALVRATNVTDRGAIYVVRVDTNQSPVTITVFVPVEHKSELFSTAPKFVGVITEVKR